MESKKKTSTPPKIVTLPPPEKAPSKDERKTRRTPVEWRASCKINQSIILGLLKDISPCGAFFAPFTRSDSWSCTAIQRREIDVNTQVSLSVQHSKSGSLIELKGTVRWIGFSVTHQCHGIGLEFHDLAPSVTALIVEIDSCNMEIDRDIEIKRLASLYAISAEILHEIKNPLAYVKVNLEYIDNQIQAGNLSPPQNISEAFDDIRIGVDHITELIGGMSIISRKAGNTPRVFDVGNAAKIALQIVRAKFRILGITVIEDLEKNSIILGHEGMLTQVFLNFLVNAIEALGDQIREPRKIEISVRRESNWVIASVADSGPGIPEDVLNRIFEPFFTTKDKKGTGLGLVICKEIVKIHKGNLSVHSNLGEGTRFDIRFPLHSESGVCNA